MSATEYVYRALEQRHTKFCVPVKFVTEEDQLLLDKSILVKRDEFRRRIVCPCGCGGLADVRRDTANGKVRYFCRCQGDDVLGEEMEVDPIEVEELSFQKVAFDKAVLDHDLEAVEWSIHDVQPKKFEEVQRHFRDFVVKVKEDMNLFSIAEAVEYIFRGVKKDEKWYVDAKRWGEVAIACGLDIKSKTMYQYAKALGKEKGTVKGHENRAKKNRKKKFVEKELKALTQPEFGF